MGISELPRIQRTMRWLMPNLGSCPLLRRRHLAGMKVIEAEAGELVRTPDLSAARGGPVVGGNTSAHEGPGEAAVTKAALTVAKLPHRLHGLEQSLRR